QPTQGLIKSAGVTVPRVTRRVFGDFEATVKVMDATCPNKDARHTDAWPGTRAGLFISGDGFAVELHVYQYYSKFNASPADEPTRCVWVDSWCPRGGAGSQLKNAEPGKSTYLRLVRKGKDVNVSYSFDGKQWSAPFNPRRALEFPDEVTVGVYLAQTTYS